MTAATALRDCWCCGAPQDQSVCAPCAADYDDDVASCGTCDGRGEHRSMPADCEDWTCYDCDGTGYADPAAARAFTVAVEARRRARGLVARRAARRAQLQAAARRGRS